MHSSMEAAETLFIILMTANCASTMLITFSKFMWLLLVGCILKAIKEFLWKKNSVVPKKTRGTIALINL